jgi:uncharacterized protein (DUF58 family)
MDIRAFLSHIVQLDIRIRKAINTQMHGNFSSVFKGSGLEFTDLRQYQYGDDVRHIDWNSTAKGHGTFIKLFKEEKEQTVFFLVDVSASQNISNGDQSKLETLKEVAGVLIFSAMQEAGNIGLCCYSDQNEKFIAPGAGKKHGYQVINELFKLIPESTGTDLKQALKFTLQILKRKSLIFVLSDFIDSDYHDLLRAMSKKHDLVIIQIQSDLELRLPSMGIIPIYDPEKRKTTWVNTSLKSFKTLLAREIHTNSQNLNDLCKQWEANYIQIKAGGDFVPSLIKLFRIRK